MINSLLIHTCCADCFLNTINYLKEEDIINRETKIISLFYNPNIHPRSEYNERLNALKKILPSNAKLIVPDYKPKEYFERIKGTKIRCRGCWDLRIKYLFEYAKKNKIKNISTTLLVSQYQNITEIKKIIDLYNQKYKLNFIEVSKEHNEKHTGFYKQNYCGCCYSLVEKMNKY